MQHLLLRIIALTAAANATRLGGRALEPYQTITSTELGGQNPNVAIGNPLKGLIESPIYTWPPYESGVPLALEFYYIGLNEIMFGNPDVVGEDDAFDWSLLDSYLDDSASRQMHVVWRVLLHFPGKALQIPQYLVDAGIELRWSDGGLSPYYGDPILMEALGQFIQRAGQRYDSDRRLAFVQAGLLGFWGEWHTGGDKLIPDETKDQVVEWYASAFPTTQKQLRSLWPAAYSAGFGVHDDSFGFTTLDGDANGGVEVHWYTWPSLLEDGYDNFWERSVMGGETRPALQDIIFEPTYPARTFEKQDFMECVEVTHATYMFHHAAFKDGGFSGQELENARSAHARMGYNFYVPEVGSTSSSDGTTVIVDVTVINIGVAPYYYDLALELSCMEDFKSVQTGVDTLLMNDSKVFSFDEVPATSECLGSVTVSLRSDYAYTERPIKFAQGDGTINFSLSLPDRSWPTPVASPVSAPVPSPTESPVAPTASPINIFAADPTRAPLPDSPSCTAADFFRECTLTSQCQNMYNGATDCSNSGGGVCYCDSDVCGCGQTAPVSAPSPPSSSSCGALDFKNECRTTGQCQAMYSGADDCWNGGGSICYCGGEVCGCL